MIRCVALAALVAGLGGCGDHPLYRIGAQQDTSHVLMAEMVGETLRRAGGRVVRVDCGGLRACVQALRGGEIDLLPAYSGDALALVRVADGMAVRDLNAARKAFSLLDLLVTRGLGFEARYAVIMRADRAAREGITGIEHLAVLADGVRMAVPPDYATRPGDGLYALSRHYGLPLAGDGPLVLDDVGERAAAVLQGRADAAIVRDFGYDLGELGLARLADRDGFFQRQAATVLIGPRASPSLAWLQGALAPLVDRVSEADMRRLMEEVVTQGWAPAQAALRLLVEKGITTRQDTVIQRPPIVLALDPRDDLGGQVEYASRVIARAFPERPVERLETGVPFAALAAGRAELALAGGARFFADARHGVLARGDAPAEAAAVLGVQSLHLLCGGAGCASSKPLAGRVGVQRRGSTGERIGSAILGALGHEPAAYLALDKLTAAVADGRVDAALLLVSGTPASLVDALGAGRVRLGSLAPHVTEVPLYLAENRVPAGHFPGQKQPIDVFSMQLLLAGPAPREGYGLRAGGPAAALRTIGQPLTLEQAEALARATATAERPDPIVPSVWERATGSRDPRAPVVEAFDTAVSLAVFAFLVWVVFRVMRRDRIEPPG